ncbi:Hypothetical predicted protein [Cloeon dipterum]|nr:Hypothetical predicted protein [Cloeon dipterum]
MFELNGLMSFSRHQKIDENVSKILKIIAEKMPNIQVLKVNVQTRFSYSDICVKRCLEISSVESISKMENLRELKIPSFKIHFFYLKNICKTLKSLQQVEVIIDFGFIEFPHQLLGSDVEDFKSCFSRLKVFLFRECSHSFTIFLMQLHRLCLQHLPNLEVMGNSASKSNCYRCHELDEQLVSSSLRYVCVAPYRQHLHLNFPNATHLKVVWEMSETEQNELDSLLRFSKIEMLYLENVPSASVLNNFIVYSSNLHTLNLKNVIEPPLEFRGIFTCFPNLQILRVKYGTVPDGDEPIQFFAKLTELKWIMTCINSKVVLSNILSAPNLQKLSLRFRIQSLDVEDLNQLASLVEQKAILGKLTYFVFSLLDICDSDFDVEVLRALRDFYQIASSSLRDLTGADLRLIHKRGCSDVGLYDSRIENCIDNIGGYFSNRIGDSSIADFLRVYKETHSSLES